MDNLEQFLRSLPIFSTFSDESMEQMLEDTAIETYAPEEIIIHSGCPGAALSILLEGEVEVVLEIQPGHRKSIRRIGEREVFGEMSLMTGNPTSADVVACGTCRVVNIPADVFSNTIAVNPDAVRHLAKLMSQKLMEDNVRMYEQIQFSEDTRHVVSHELKSPFASIATLAMTILEPAIPMEKKEEFLQRIISKALDARTMVEEYLTLSAISSGGMRIVSARVNLCDEIIQKILDQHREIMAEKGMTAGIHVPKELEVVCDPKYIQIVYSNLVTNAAKYGARDTEICLGHEGPKNGYHYLSVANAGEWIKEGDREKIFEKYVRLGKRGTGIGLHTTKTIVREHGGDIHVEPCYFVKGSCISQRLTAEEAVAATDELITGNNFVFTIPA